MADASIAATVIPFAQSWEPAARHRLAARLVANMQPAVRKRVAALAAELITINPLDEDCEALEWLEEAVGLQVLTRCGITICHDRNDGRQVYRLTALGWAAYNLIAKEPIAI